jgi:hypothetical protein
MRTVYGFDEKRKLFLSNIVRSKEEKISQHLKLEQKRNRYLLTTFSFDVHVLGLYTYPFFIFKKKLIHIHHFLFFSFLLGFFLCSIDKCRKNVKEKTKKEKSTNLLLHRWFPLSLLLSFSQPFS